MKKIMLTMVLSVLVLAGLMVLFLYQKPPKDIALGDIEKVFLEEYSIDGMEKAGDMRMKRAFGLNAADFEEYLYYTPDNTMSVNELLIVKLRDESQADNVLSAMESRLNTQKKNFDGYGTNQTDLLNHAKVFGEGRYVCFLVSEDVDGWYDTVRKAWRD